MKQTSGSVIMRCARAVKAYKTYKDSSVVNYFDRLLLLFFFHKENCTVWNSDTISQPVSHSAFQSVTLSVCSLLEAVMPLRIAAVHTSQCLGLQRLMDTHTHTHTHTYRDTHINYMQSLNCPPLLFIPHFTSSLSFFQHLWGPQSAAGMMDSRLISKENHPSPLTSQNSRREASMPFRKNK